MILQALFRYYEILSNDPQSDIAPLGYSMAGVGFALNVNEKGELLDVIPLFDTEQRGQKTIEVPHRMLVPQQVKRSGISPTPNFLCDNQVFVLGVSDKVAQDPAYALKRFESFRQFNTELLAQADCASARAVIAFLDKFNPAVARDQPAIARNLESLLKGGNLVFMFRGAFVHDDPPIRQVWEAHKASRDAVLGQCLVTGEIAPIARLHPSLKRVRGAQPSGASLVSFNERAYESYNRAKGQGLNSPVSEHATFGYTTALNYLLSPANPNKKFYLGDTTIVYWAESEKLEYAHTFASLFDPGYVVDQPAEEPLQRKKSERRMKEVAEKVRRVQPLDDSRLIAGLDASTRFYVLGLAPNAARIAVRFFLTDPFGKMVERIMRHYNDLEIVKEYADQPDFISVRQILNETVSKKSKDKDASPLMAGAVTRAILSGAPYPAALYYAIINRVRADMDEKGIRKINYVRAAVIKAFLIRKYRHQTPHPYQEVLIMSLNEQSTIPAYLLGRLFAVLEKAQVEAIGDVNASIKDRYFTSACASPASVFPVLLRLSQHHISKAEYGYVNDRRIQGILDSLDVESNPIPARLTLDEQGVFILGYYHQRAAFYAPRNKDRSSEPAT